MTPRAGVLLNGRYELLARIAVGGMGEVWAAQDRSTRREVAAKVLRPEFAGEQLFLDRLAAEARNSATLVHPGIARTHDHGVTDGLGWLIMDLVKGEPLTAVLSREQVLPVHVVLSIVAQTADALAVAHRAQVVHRDIKPANLLLGPGGTVTVTDFGISIAADQAPMTAAGMVMGTAQYLPPEQAMGRAATGAGDLYALGIIAYEALAGQRPFTGATQVDIAFAHVSDPVPPLPLQLPAPVRAFVMRLLEKDPERRPADAAAVAARARALARTYAPADPHAPVAAPGAAPARERVPATLRSRRALRDSGRPVWHPARWWRTAAIVLLVALMTLVILLVGNLGGSTALASASILVIRGRSMAGYWRTTGTHQVGAVVGGRGEVQ